MRGFLFLLIFGLTGVAILVGLGTWQVQRLAWKQGILDEIDARIAADPVALPEAPDADRDKYLPVVVDGVIAPDELHVLVSVKRVGPGFRIIAPFETSDGRRLLLDRGYVGIAQLEETRSTGPATVTGNLHWPDDRTNSTPPNDVAGNVWFARDLIEMAAELGTEPLLLIARTPTDAKIRPLPVDSAGIPNDHLQYAITWFSLALIWIVMTASFLWRGRARSEGQV